MKNFCGCIKEEIKKRFKIDVDIFVSRKKHQLLDDLYLKNLRFN